MITTDSATAQTPAGDQPLLSYHRSSDKIQPADPTPRLRVFPDGRVLVYRPFYHVDAGLWEARVPVAELRRFTSRIIALGMGSLALENARAERATQAASERSAGLEQHRSENAISEFGFDLTADHAAAIGLQTALPDRVTAQWINLQPDARRFPAIDTLARLAEIEREIWAWMDGLSLQRVADPLPMEALR